MPLKDSYSYPPRHDQEIQEALHCHPSSCHRSRTGALAMPRNIERISASTLLKKVLKFTWQSPECLLVYYHIRGQAKSKALSAKDHPHLIYLLNVTEQRCFILRPDEQPRHFYTQMLIQALWTVTNLCRLGSVVAGFVSLSLRSISRSVESRKLSPRINFVRSSPLPTCAEDRHQSWAHCGTFSSRVAQEDGVGALVPSPAAGGSRCNFSTVNSISQHAES